MYANQGISQLVLQKTIKGGITPKSIVHNGNGLFFAQNMIYMHTITVYNDQYELVKKIPDRVNLNDYGYTGGTVKGGPVEACFSHNGEFAWVSNYTMEGGGYTNPGCDACSGSTYDKGFVYKINTNDYNIDEIIEVGAVPKFLACSPDNKYILVSNWTSKDVSVIDASSNKVLKSIPVGVHPRGIVVDNASKYAYIAIMGSNKILRLSLEDWSKSWIYNVGKAPRHLCISNDDKYLYCSVNSAHKIVKINTNTLSIEASCQTGSAPRSMEITPDSRFLYVVNYHSNTVSKVRTKDMFEVCENDTKEHPIGITFNPQNSEVWVACYSGYIQIFKDTSLIPSLDGNFQPDLLAQMDNYENMLMSESITIDRNGAKNELATPVSPATETEREPEPKSEQKEKSKTKESNLPPSPAEVIKPAKTSSAYIIIGSFKNIDNATRLAKETNAKGFEATTIPSSKAGFTYVALIPNGDLNSYHKKVKSELKSNAWVYKP